MARTVEQALLAQIAQLVLLNARQSVQIETLTERVRALEPPAPAQPPDAPEAAQSSGANPAEASHA